MATSNLLNSSSAMTRRASSRGRRPKHSVEQATNTAPSVQRNGAFRPRGVPDVPARGTILRGGLQGKVSPRIEHSQIRLMPATPPLLLRRAGPQVKRLHGKGIITLTEVVTYQPQTQQTHRLRFPVFWRCNESARRKLSLPLAQSWPRHPRCRLLRRQPFRERTNGK